MNNACESTLKDMEHSLHLSMKDNILLWSRTTQPLQSDRPDSSLKSSSGVYYARNFWKITLPL